MNVLPMEKQILVVNALAEGSSIRSIERITGIHRDTIMRLGIYIGEGCTHFLKEVMVNLPCKRIEMDELWAFVGKKQKNVPRNERDSEFGDAWTYVAVDPETKIVPSFLVGKHNALNTEIFVNDIASRMQNRIQLSSDQLLFYSEAVENVFGGNVDYGQVVKTFGASVGPTGKYTPPILISCRKKKIVGKPKKSYISTSMVETQNLTIRMHCRRLTRLTNAFSKKLDNLKASIGLHFGYYNFVKVHQTLRTTPAMAIGLTNHIWTMGELIERAK